MIQTCDGENGKICSDCSFFGVKHASVVAEATRVQSELTTTGGLADDKLAELFGHRTTDFFPFE